MNKPTLFLGSTSSYRRALLDRLQVQYKQVSPDYIERDLPGEDPVTMALRQAEGKAKSISPDVEHYIIIGSDQVAHMDGEKFGKPGNKNNAIGQLERFQGNWVTFTTAICLITPSDPPQCTAESYEIKFRDLSRQEIEHYLDREQTYDCAGSIKVESLGITLLEDARGRDITTLYGLPLMLLREQLSALQKYKVLL